MRSRNFFLGLAVLISSLLLIIADANSGIITDMTYGAALLGYIVVVAKSSFGVLMLFLTTKMIMPYKEADFQDLGKRANRTAEGAGQYAMAASIRVLAYAVVIAVSIMV